MAIGSVGYANPYAGYVNFQGSKKNSEVGCGVFPYPKNPGLIPPKRDENKAAKNAAKALGVVAALALAYVFRGKIKNGVKALKPFAEGAIAKGKELVKQGAKAVEPYIQKAKKAATGLIDNAKPVAQKAWTAVKNFFKNAKPTA